MVGATEGEHMAFEASVWVVGVVVDIEVPGNRGREGLVDKYHVTAAGVLEVVDGVGKVFGIFSQDADDDGGGVLASLSWVSNEVASRGNVDLAAGGLPDGLSWWSTGQCGSGGESEEGRCGWRRRWWRKPGKRC